MRLCINKTVCRRHLILKYFGEQSTKETCALSCDVCMANVKFQVIDVTDQTKEVIKCVRETRDLPGKNEFTLKYMSKIITGKKVRV